MSNNTQRETWEEIVIRVLKKNKVSLVTYVPDNVLAQLIKLIEADPYFTVIAPAREEEAVGIVAGAYMAGKRGIALMQTSGFATIVNVLASLACPYQIPVVAMVSERGTLGEFQLGQSIVCRTMRPVLTSLGMEHFAIQDHDQVEFVVDGMRCPYERSNGVIPECRMEVSPAQAAKEDYFLHVITTTDYNRVVIEPAKLQESGYTVTVTVAGGVAITFQKQAVAGSVTINGKTRQLCEANLKPVSC